jgi:type IV fimbrial biogenesis protein FimT
MIRPPKQSAGFTLLELMTTLSVAAIVLAFAVPNFRDIIRNNRLTAAANDLQRSAQVARAEAVKRQLPVVVCASGDANADTPVCNDGDFRQWIVFVDTDGDWDADGLEPVLERHAALDPSITVRNNGNGIVSYAASGFAQPAVADGKVPTGLVILCDARGNQQVGDNSTARAMYIEATGRTRITRDPDDVANAIAEANAGGCP